MASINKVFFRGLITLLPITLTVYILYSAIIILENLLGSFLRILLPTYIPGLGLVLTLVLIYMFGLLLNNYITGRILMSLEERLTRVPFLKAIYSPLRDLMNLFSQKEPKEMGKVVLVKIGDSGIRMLGIVTRESFTDLNFGALGQDKVSVYVPFSYGLGGYTLLVEKSQVTEVNIPIEKAMSLAITGWVKTDTKPPGVRDV
ncbi:MAG: DUF502 domain-containing protein [Bdellovibrionaceae bacterium]|nr:DUF502 domain-containing protein [Pseudobdellovibrionaceae bacterium]